MARQLDEIDRQSAANAIAIDGLKAAVLDIVNRIMLPMAETVDSQADHLTRIEASLATVTTNLAQASQVLALVTGLAEHNVRDIADGQRDLARAEALVTATAENLDVTRDIVASNAQAIAHHSKGLEDTRELVAQNAELFSLMLDENRAERIEWRRRLDRIEQAA